ncbi:MAG: M48 family metalloprotease [Cyanobacteriota bacterium]
MASVPNPSLDAGLRALKQGNYLDAIAHLREVCETELDETIVTRASQGLVTAYQRSGDTENAIAVCRNLTHHPDSKVRAWADSALFSLNAEPATPAKSSSASDSTGFVPIDGSSSASDSTGFVPLDSTPPQPQTPPRGTASNIKQRLASSTQRLLSNTKIQEGQRSTASTTGKALEDAQINSESLTDHPSLHPVSYTPPSSPVPSLFTPRPRWRNSGRAQNWSPLKSVKLIRLWLGEIVTAIALFWVLHFSLGVMLQATNTLLVQLPLFQPIQLFYRDPTQAIAIILAILLIGSPWLIDALLKYFHGLQKFPLTQLASRNPEAAKVVQQFCRQRKISVPNLGILPTNAPVALTYGNLPRTARIVVSEGLLAQLADDEIATIYAEQLGHIVHWDFVLMSLGVLITQIPYTIYWQVAQWGEQIPEFIERKLPSYRRLLPPIIRAIAGVVASISYGFYWVFRLPLLWFSRARVYYSDRVAAQTTGNPNGMTRALLKIALGIAEEIQHDQKTSGLLESFDLILPVGYRQSLTLGSCSPQMPFESVLQWECTNPYRDWLNVTASHPLLGERVAVLCRNAQFWKLDPELDLPAIAPPVRTNAARLSKLSNSNKALPILQSALFFGLLLGIILRAILWIVGQIGDRLDIWQIIWMHNASPFLDACILIAFSLSIFLWINPYFPDIKPSTVQSEPNLGNVFANPSTLPPDSQPVQLSGKLLGRQGLFNGLGQDLILQTSTGLVRLHYSPHLGPFGNLLPQSTRPSNLVNQQVTVTGWLRRGVTPWIDVETLRSQGGKVTRAYYPLWLTIIAFAAALWGAYLIWQA